MFSIKWICEHPEEFDNYMERRGLAPVSKEIIRLDTKRREIISLLQQLQAAKNKKLVQLKNFKIKSGIEFELIKRDVEDINDKLKELEKSFDYKHFYDLLEELPNILDEKVPFGSNSSMNQLVKSCGEVRDRNILPLTHLEIGQMLDIIDSKKTVEMSGSRFISLKGDGAKLERALINFMIDVHTKEFGFLELSPPYLVLNEAMKNVGQLPKFADDSFETTTGHRLIPTGEVPLVNMVTGCILDKMQLPIRYTAYTPCFRSEAGSAGRDTKGLIRLHQFAKVELVSITAPEQSEEEHQYILNAAEEILRRLKIPYRVMLLCAGDTGFASKKTYDLEVWLPGMQEYREISSVSNCGDFQARRMKARYRNSDLAATDFVHTLNGSALAVGRTIVAILENYYQNEENSLIIPDVLVDYMGGQTKILPPKKE